MEKCFPKVKGALNSKSPSRATAQSWSSNVQLHIDMTLLFLGNLCKKYNNKKGKSRNFLVFKVQRKGTSGDRHATSPSSVSTAWPGDCAR